MAAKPVRAANEGSKDDKKWANATELKQADEDSYIQGSSEKTKSQKQRKEKNFLDVDLRYVEPARTGPSNGPRGGRGGRGGDRPRGDRAPRGGGDRAPRGGPRGGAAPRGASAPRGGRGGARGGAPAAGPTVDEKNFPSLGGN